MEIVLVLIAVLFGVANTDSLGYHISRLLSWRRTKLSGDWNSQFKKNGDLVMEHVLLDGAFGDVTWGIVQVESTDAKHRIPYRIKVVHEYQNIYSDCENELWRIWSDTASSR